MRYSAIPVVTAPFGLTLGGGAEVTMGGNAVQASAELYMGLVEVGRWSPVRSVISRLKRSGLSGTRS